MKFRFANLWSRIGAKTHPANIFEKLSKSYDVPARYYHTFYGHINECMKDFDHVENNCNSPDAVELALFYHDAIYDPRKFDNEENSALYAMNDIDIAGVSKRFSENVKGLIMFTNHIFLPKSIDEKMIVDIDLGILGKDNERFKQYERDIRKEYSYVPDELFKEKRKEILQGFLDRPSIYNTDFFKDKYEKNARKNILDSIDNLSRWM